jgi:hypothetical protein
MNVAKTGMWGKLAKNQIRLQVRSLALWAAALPDDFFGFLNFLRLRCVLRNCAGGDIPLSGAASVGAVGVV